MQVDENLMGKADLLSIV